jgi:hypothetical protein
MNYAFQGGATSKSIELFIMDAASTPAGQGKTGLVFNTSGLAIGYRRPGDAAYTAITLATLASGSAAYSSGGFVELDASKAPGKYRLDLPNAAIAAGVQQVEVQWKGTNVVDDYACIGVLPYDPTAVDKAGYALGATGLDPVLDGVASVETNLSLRGWFRLAGSILFGKSSGVDSGSPIYRDFNDSKNRVASTASSGNRSAFSTRDQT